MHLALREMAVGFKFRLGLTIFIALGLLIYKGAYADYNGYDAPDVSMDRYQPPDLGADQITNTPYIGTDDGGIGYQYTPAIPDIDAFGYVSGEIPAGEKIGATITFGPDTPLTNSLPHQDISMTDVMVNDMIQEDLANPKGPQLIYPDRNGFDLNKITPESAFQPVNSDDAVLQNAPQSENKISIPLNAFDGELTKTPAGPSFIYSDKGQGYTDAGAMGRDLIYNAIKETYGVDLRQEGAKPVPQTPPTLIYFDDKAASAAAHVAASQDRIISVSGASDMEFTQSPSLLYGNPDGIPVIDPAQTDVFSNEGSQGQLPLESTTVNPNGPWGSFETRTVDISGTYKPGDVILPDKKPAKDNTATLDQTRELLYDDGIAAGNYKYTSLSVKPEEALTISPENVMHWLDAGELDANKINPQILSNIKEEYGRTLH